MVNFFMVRLGSIRPWRLSSFLNINDILHCLSDLEKKYLKLKGEFLDDLHNHNHKNCTGKTQQQIQNIRRKLFNEKIKESEIDLLKLLITNNLAARLVELLDVKSGIEEQKELLKIKLVDQEKLELSELQGIIGSEMNNSLKTMPLSSYDFSECLLSNRFDRELISEFDNKNRNRLISVYKYLTRIIYKTSPFGRFNEIGVGTFSTGFTQLVRIKSKSSVYSEVRINNAIYKLIKLIITMSKCTVGFNICVNQTMSEKDNTLFYYHNDGGNDRLSRLTQNPTVQKIVELTRKESRFDEIVAQLLPVVNDTEENIKKYILKLLESGILIKKYCVSEVNVNWPYLLMKNYSQVEDPIIDEAKELLQELIEISNKHNTSSFRDRLVLQKKALFLITNFVETGIRIGSRPDTDKKKISSFSQEIIDTYHIRLENIFFEDLTSNIDVILNKDIVKKISHILTPLLQDTKSHDIRNNNKFDMIDFWDSNLGGNESFPVLEFYEKYYREWRQMDEEEKDYKFKKTQAYTDLLKSYSEKISDILHREKVENADNVVQLDSDTLKGPSRDSDTELGSYAIYCQLVLGEKPLFVINKILEGDRRSFSRFLPYFDDKFSDEIVDQLNKSNKEAIYFDLADTSSFNANIRPGIIPNEIVLPNGEQIDTSSTVHNIKDFSVRLNKKKEIFLQNEKENKRAYIIDTSIQDARTRSKLSQLLYNFSLNDVSDLSVIKSLVNKRYYETIDENISIHPRITIDDFLVIQRKFWIIKKDFFKFDEDPLEFFIQLNKSRISLNIPDETFYTTDLSAMFGKNKPSVDYKPLYLNFLSRVSVLTFQKQINKMKDEIRLEEMLPSTEQLLDDDEGNLVSEFVIQIDQN